MGVNVALSSRSLAVAVLRRVKVVRYRVVVFVVNDANGHRR